MEPDPGKGAFRLPDHAADGDSTTDTAPRRPPFIDRPSSADRLKPHDRREQHVRIDRPSATALRT
ncbi:hypothetical protein [Streptomyces sp. CBMA29]|uniref:hypothetical protein n=1 Tax=Streptomyces sp. CBMA29 TaxID=1896314 RepID=UPI001661B149|nr:hypothetical protein [Streptomyces sp. CBMA29]MBD0737603.1 hypothetical protein [Streptomyces sp. CBMA29]